MRKVKIDPATQRRPESRKQQRNAKIREALTQHVEVQEIPAIADMEGYEKPKPRVCAYCRVSTDMDTQALSYELQVQNYTEYINGNPDWEFAGIYADRGISGTSLKHRDEFNRMIADRKVGSEVRMKTYDVKCPLCGAINHSLYMEETDGWMECEKCGQVVKVLHLVKTKKIPLFTGKELAVKFGATSG